MTNRASPTSSQPRYFASLWSLRGYPRPAGEWSWSEKLRAVRQAGFDGIMSPPRAEVRERGDLQYLAISSVRSASEIPELIHQAAQLKAVSIVVQLGTPTIGITGALKLTVALEPVNE